MILGLAPCTGSLPAQTANGKGFRVGKKGLTLFGMTHKCFLFVFPTQAAKGPKNVAQNWGRFAGRRSFTSWRHPLNRTPGFQRLLSRRPHPNSCWKVVIFSPRGLGVLAFVAGLKRETSMNLGGVFGGWGCGWGPGVLRSMT